MDIKRGGEIVPRKKETTINHTDMWGGLAQKAEGKKGEGGETVGKKRDSGNPFHREKRRFVLDNHFERKGKKNFLSA